MTLTCCIIPSILPLPFFDSFFVSSTVSYFSFALILLLVPNDDDAATRRWKETKERDMRYQRERKEETRERNDKFWGSLRRIISAGFRGKTVLEVGKKWNSTLCPKKNTRSIMMLQKNEDRTKDEYRIWNRFRSNLAQRKLKSG